MFGNEADIVWTVIYHRSDYKKIKGEVYIQGHCLYRLVHN